MGFKVGDRVRATAAADGVAPGSVGVVVSTDRVSRHDWVACEYAVRFPEGVELSSHSISSIVGEEGCFCAHAHELELVRGVVAEEDRVEVGTFPFLTSPGRV